MGRFVFAITFMLNLFLIGSGASGAVPFGTMLAILALYFLISGPLCVGGYLYGMRHGVSSSSYLQVCDRMLISPRAGLLANCASGRHRFDTSTDSPGANSKISETLHRLRRR